MSSIDVVRKGGISTGAASECVHAGNVSGMQVCRQRRCASSCAARPRDMPSLCTRYVGSVHQVDDRRRSNVGSRRDAVAMLFRQARAVRSGTLSACQSTLAQPAPIAVVYSHSDRLFKKMGVTRDNSER